MIKARPYSISFFYFQALVVREIFWENIPRVPPTPPIAKHVHCTVGFSCQEFVVSQKHGMLHAAAPSNFPFVSDGLGFHHDDSRALKYFLVVFRHTPFTYVLQLSSYRGWCCSILLPSLCQGLPPPPGVTFLMFYTLLLVCQRG